MGKLIIREAKRKDIYSIAKIHADAWNTTYMNIIPEEYLKNRTYEGQAKKVDG